MKIYDIEFVKTVHRIVIAHAEIKLPITIDKKLYFISKLLKPAIRLPVHTPVKGIGTATKPAKARYFFKADE